MRALLFETYGGPLQVRDVPEPAVPRDGVVLRVGASGVCRSDWHGWQGHDPDITLPHVPGHELAGTVAAVGPDVTRWQVGDRVTAPFVCACGRCPVCRRGDGQVCPAQTQPGFTHWGSYAELVALHAADVNLVALPDGLSLTVAASLGCRLATAFRAVVRVAGVAAGEQVAVLGCGGLGLSAVQVAAAAGARVVAVDVAPGALELAARCGADALVRVAPDTAAAEVAAQVAEASGGGVDVSLDALGAPVTCAASVLSLLPRGRHVQVGLLPEGAHVPLDRVVARELAVLGSHGAAAHDYPALLGLVTSGRLRPEQLVTREIGLEDASGALAAVGREPGTTVITRFTPSR